MKVAIFINAIILCFASSHTFQKHGKELLNYDEFWQLYDRSNYTCPKDGRLSGCPTGWMCYTNTEIVESSTVPWKCSKFYCDCYFSWMMKGETCQQIQPLGLLVQGINGFGLPFSIYLFYCTQKLYRTKRFKKKHLTGKKKTSALVIGMRTTMFYAIVDICTVFVAIVVHSGYSRFAYDHIFMTNIATFLLAMLGVSSFVAELFVSLVWLEMANAIVNMQKHSGALSKKIKYLIWGTCGFVFVAGCGLTAVNLVHFALPMVACVQVFIASSYWYGSRRISNLILAGVGSNSNDHSRRIIQEVSKSILLCADRVLVTVSLGCVFNAIWAYSYATKHGLMNGLGADGVWWSLRFSLLAVMLLCRDSLSNNRRSGGSKRRVEPQTDATTNSTASHSMRVEI